MKTYVYGSFGILAILLISTIGFCWTADPYRVFGTVQDVEYFEPNVRLWKTRHINNSFRAIDGYVLGNSRAAQFPSSEVNRSGVRYFNYATSSETMAETCAKMRYVYGLGGPVKEIVLFLSLDALSQPDQPPVRDLLRRESPQISGATRFSFWCDYLLSFEAIDASFDVLNARTLKKKEMRYAPDGTITYLWRQAEPFSNSAGEKTTLGITTAALQRELSLHREMAQMAQLHGTKVCVVLAPVPDPQWTQCKNDPAVKSFLEAIAGLYSSSPLYASDPKLYQSYVYWNDSTHPTQEALVEFIAPMVRKFFLDNP